MKNNIPVYAAEANIEHLIKESNIVTSDAVLIKDASKEVSFDSVNLDVSELLASDDENSEFVKTIIKDSKHVTLLSSILVSSIVNKNDDCFSSQELIKAYQTPQYKPINWQHNGNEVRGNETIGVMVATSLLSGPIENLKELDLAEADENNDEVTGLVHIRQDGVIWSSYFPTYSENIREGIEDDKLFVSMECFYSDFGYAIELGNGEIDLVHRDEDNAQASENLRCYGGSGKILIKGRECRIARWLKGIEFSGQGIVNSPANVQDGKPLSIIFSKHHNKTKKKKNSNYAKLFYHEGLPVLESDSLSDKEFFVYNELANINNKGDKMDKPDRTAELEKQLADTQAELDEYIKKVASLESSELQAQIDSLVESAKKDKEDKEKMKEEMEELKTKAGSFEELQAKFEQIEKEKSELLAELEAIKALETARNRESELKEIAADKVEVPYDIEALTEMSDETFEAVKLTLEAGVSGLAKLTDQTVSSEPKSTDQTVSTETKLTEASADTDDEASKSSDEASEALEDATAENEEADLVLSGNTNDAENKAERRKEVARTLLKRAIPGK